MSVSITFTDGPWAQESPVVQVAGESITYVCTFLGGKVISAVGSTPTAYKNRTSVTSTVFPAGTTSATANQVTLKPLTSLTGGSRYVIVVSVTLDGNTTIKKFEVISHSPKMEQ